MRKILLILFLLANTPLKAGVFGDGGSFRKSNLIEILLDTVSPAQKSCAK